MEDLYASIRGPYNPPRRVPSHANLLRHLIFFCVRHHLPPAKVILSRVIYSEPCWHRLDTHLRIESHHHGLLFQSFLDA